MWRVCGNTQRLLERYKKGAAVFLTEPPTRDAMTEQLRALRRLLEWASLPAAD